jgi:hypothetical protein
VSGRLKLSTACSTQFLETSIHGLEKSEQIISGELQVANGYHGLDHPAVAIDVPELECECTDSFSFEANTLEASACREGGEVYWIVSVHGLVAGFEYKFDFEWFDPGKQKTHHWYTIFSSSTSSYAVRQLLSQISKTTSVWEAYTQDRFEIDVTVRDMHPGLTSEVALIGTRRINSAVNTVRLTCAKLPATIHDKGFEHIGQNGLDANSTASRTSFETGVHVVEKSEQIISGEMQVANMYHGLDHPEVVIDVPELECECKSSHCREEGEVYWIVAVRGLVAGFKYEFHFQWFVEGDKNGNYANMWKSNFSTRTSSHKVRQPLSQISQKSRGLNMNTSVWDAYIPRKGPFEIEVTVRDLNPGLTSEEALIGTRRMNSAVNTFNVRCSDSDSGERTKVPDGEEDEWQYNFSAATEDVRISYSETVVALAMLNRYGLDEWARISQNMSDDGHTVSDLHIPAVVFNHKQDGRRASAEGMLRAVGFRDITFQPTYESATLDLAALESSGRVSSANWDYFVKEQMGWKYITNASKMRYIAHVLDFQDVIERHAAAADGSPSASSWIAVFEDDIVLTTSPVHAHKRLFEAVSSLPRNADVLHVEWCFDWCEESRFHTSYPLISLASGPHCSAGVLLSTQGARKLDRLLRPIDSTIDNMFANLCRESAVICYKLRLPIFTQDRKWGSAVDFKKQKVVSLILYSMSLSH